MNRMLLLLCNYSEPALKHSKLNFDNFNKTPTMSHLLVGSKIYSEILLFLVGKLLNLRSVAF